jgi:hypothetical protein
MTSTARFRISGVAPRRSQALGVPGEQDTDAAEQHTDHDGPHRVGEAVPVVQVMTTETSSDHQSDQRAGVLEQDHGDGRVAGLEQRCREATLSPSAF